MMSTLTWMSVKLFFKRAWVWCKKYWQFLVGASIPIIIWALTRDSSKLDEVVTRIKKDHEKEKDIINKAHEDEIAARESALKEHKDRLAKIEREHEEARVGLTAQKKKKIEKIIKENKDDPDEITRRISDLTGISVHVE